MRRSGAAVALAGFLSALTAVAAESIRIPVAERDVAADLELPERLPAPLVIIAPGQAYPRNGFLLEELSRQAAHAGFASLRFDWRYTAAKGDVSPGLVREVEDFRAVVRWARADPRFAALPIYASGKSLGSMVAARVFGEDAALAGAILLTPVCRERAEAEAWYAKAKIDPRPVAWIQGASDPVCPLDALYGWLPGSRMAVSVLPGDHGFIVRAGDRAANDAVSKDAAGVAVRWLVQMQGSRAHP